MRKETNDALNDVIKDLTNIPGGTDQKLSMDMMVLVNVITNADSDFHDAVNELCYTCGAYKRAHEGACNGCRWKTVKEGFQ